MRSVPANVLGSVIPSAAVNPHTTQPDALAHASGDWFMLALEAGQLGAWNWDRRMGRITWTRPLAAIFHVPSESFDGRYTTFLKLVHPDDRRGLRIKVVRARGQRQLYQHEYRLADVRHGETWIRATGRFYYNARGHAYQMVGVVQDITAIRRRSKREAEAERREALATLTAGVAHEFNGLLLAAAAFLDTSVYQSEAAIGPNLRHARNAITHAQSLSAALLDAYMDDGRPSRPLMLSEWLPAALLRIQGAAGSRVEVEHVLAARGSRVAIHGSVLEHALRILVNNAADAGARNIRVVASRQAATGERGPRIEITVQDDGSGIAPELQARIFQRYFSTRSGPGRSGLGLSLADELLRGAGGRLELVSSAVGSTRFRISLAPAQEFPALEAPPQESMNEAAHLCNR